MFPRAYTTHKMTISLQFQLSGLGRLSEEKAIPIVKTLDATLGVACVSLLAGINNRNRVELGGLPGDYRALDTALEYYALGNAYLCHPMIANLVFDFARKCAMLGQRGFGKYWKADEKEVLSCMMELDVDLAHTIMNRNKDLMMKSNQSESTRTTAKNLARY